MVPCVAADVHALHVLYLHLRRTVCMLSVDIGHIHRTYSFPNEINYDKYATPALSKIFISFSLHAMNVNYLLKLSDES